MAGVRLHHPTLRSAEGTRLTYVVELPQPYPAARMCPACNKEHARKAIHLRLDAHGDVVVSPEVYGKLREVFLGGLEVANPVPTPAPQFIGAVPSDKQRIVEAPLSGLAAAEKITPARTAYENRDRLHRPYLPLIQAQEQRADRLAAARLRKLRRMFVISRSA